MANKQSKYEEVVEQILTPIAEKNGVYVYDVEYVKEGPDFYLNCYIDKEDGVNIGDCEAVSRELSDKMDELDPIPDAYTLVVSSPGLGRQLKKDRHFEHSLGEKVEGTTFSPLEETKSKSFEGILASYDQDTVKLETENGDLVINRKDIAKIRLVVEF